MSYLEPPRGYTRPMNGTAVGALMAGLVGVLVALMLSPILGAGLGIAAVALGVGGLGVAESRLRDAGRTMAIAGLVLGGAAMGAGAVGPWSRRPRSDQVWPSSRAEIEARTSSASLASRSDRRG
jgi:drug/metabolite transporter (DMT)-like permease